MNNTVLLQANSKYIKYSGRFSSGNSNSYDFSYSACSISICTNATYIEFDCQDACLNTGEQNYISVYVNNAPIATYKLSNNRQSIPILTQADGGYNTVLILKRTEAQVGKISFYGFKLSAHADCKIIEDLPTKFLLIGDSITCGYANESSNAEEPFSPETENAYMSSTAICARKCNAEYHVVAFSGKGIYRNYDEAPGERDNMPIIFERTHPLEAHSVWNHSQYIPECILINLGTNDFSPPFGITKEDYISSYSKFIHTLTTYYPKARIIIINSQMLEGNERATQISWLKQIAKAFVHVYFCEISQQGILGYGGDWHPNIAQNKLNAAEIYRFLISENIM